MSWFYSCVIQMGKPVAVHIKRAATSFAKKVVRKLAADTRLARKKQPGAKVNWKK